MASSLDVVGYASQPDLVLSAQKDNYYVTHTQEVLYNAFEKVAGGVIATDLYPEIKAASMAVYFLVTTGVCQQTLGEEFCNIFPVNSNNFQIASLRKRLGLVVSLVTVPYAIERWRLGPPSGLYQYQTSLVRNQYVVSFSKRVSRVCAAGSQQLQRCLHWLDGFRAWRILRDGIFSRLPGASVLIQHLSRLHLAIFFIYGTFYDIPRRLFRARHIVSRRPLEQQPRASYRLLGFLIGAQLALSAGIAAVSSLRSMWSQLVPLPRHNAGAIHTLVPSSRAAAQARRVGGFPDSIEEPKDNCPICSTRIRDAAVCVCGHMFCWDCIIMWVGKKPLCPLCREPSPRQSIMCVYDC